MASWDPRVPGWGSARNDPLLVNLAIRGDRFAPLAITRAARGLLPRRVDRVPLLDGRDGHALQVLHRRHVPILRPQVDPGGVVPDLLLGVAVQRLSLLHIHRGTGFI